jgi:hypothetical protein
MRTPRARLRLAVGFGAALIAMSISATPAGAATTVYPAGGSAFTSSPEGWSPGEVSCAPAALLCTPEAVHDTSVGNPAGSIAAKTTITLNLLNLFKGTEVWDSPKFTVPAGPVSGASIRLDRTFEPGGLIKVEPKSTYTVTLRDLTAGTSAAPLSEEVSKEDTTFATRSTAANLVGGHTYQLSISATTAQSVLALSLLNGTTALRFDNVGLVVQTPGGGGGGGGTGGSENLLANLIRSSLIGPAILKGKRIFVKAKCPAAIGSACRITLRGMLNRRQPATRARNAKIGKGKTKRVVIKVKPKARPRLVSRKRLLFKETVRAGGATATVYKSLRLIRR